MINSSQRCSWLRDPQDPKFQETHGQGCSLWWLVLAFVVILLGWVMWPKAEQPTVLRNVGSTVRETCKNADGSSNYSKTIGVVGLLTILPLYMIYNYLQTGPGASAPICEAGEFLETASDGTQKCVTPWTSFVWSGCWAVPLGGLLLWPWRPWRTGKTITGTRSIQADETREAVS